MQDYYKYRNGSNIIRCENNSYQRQQLRRLKAVLRKSMTIKPDNAKSDVSDQNFVIRENTRLKHRCPLQSEPYVS